MEQPAHDLGTSLMGIGRIELFSELGIIKAGPDLETATLDAYKLFEDKLHSGELSDGILRERGHEWHTSFHASWFPPPKGCARQAMYSLMDMPDGDPVSPMGRGIMLMGKALERQIVYRWGIAGLLISGSVSLYPDEESPQTRFNVPELWTSGSIDAALDMRRYGWNAVLPIDVKGKDPDRLELIRRGEQKLDAEYYYQMQSYIWLCRYFHEAMGWDAMGLEMARGGVIHYASRARPTDHHSVYIPYDEAFVVQAIAQIQDWRKAFEAGELPQRPTAWRWTETPCDWCGLKKHVCKPDVKAGTTRLDESVGIDFAKSLNPNYDYAAKRAAVLERWN